MGGSGNTVQMVKGLLIERRAGILFQELNKTTEMAQRCAQVVRDGVAEGFQFLIGGGELSGAKVQVRVELDDLGFDLFLHLEQAIAFSFRLEPSAEIAL